jgi:hypothetical protein
MFGENPHPPTDEGGGKGLGVMDPEGIPVQDLCSLDQKEIPGVGGGGPGIGHESIGEHEIIGREFSSIVPLHPFAEMKGDRKLVGGHLPGFGQIPYDVVIFVIFHQAIVEEAADLVRSGIPGDIGDHAAGISDGAQDDRVSRRWLPIPEIINRTC